MWILLKKIVIKKSELDKKDNQKGTEMQFKLSSKQAIKINRAKKTFYLPLN